MADSEDIAADTSVRVEESAVRVHQVMSGEASPSSVHHQLVVDQTEVEVISTTEQHSSLERENPERVVVGDTLAESYLGDTVQEVISGTEEQVLSSNDQRMLSATNERGLSDTSVQVLCSTEEQVLPAIQQQVVLMSDSEIYVSSQESRASQSSQPSEAIISTAGISILNSILKNILIHRLIALIHSVCRCR